MRAEWIKQDKKDTQENTPEATPDRRTQDQDSSRFFQGRPSSYTSVAPPWNHHVMRAPGKRRVRVGEKGLRPRVKSLIGLKTLAPERAQTT